MPLALLGVLCAGQPPRVWGRSRDFTALPPAPAPPSVRSGPVFISITTGADFLVARWHEPNPLLPGRAIQVGPGLRFAMGAMLRERLAIYAEGSVTAPVVPFLTGLAVASAGVGADWFTDPANGWRARVLARRAWASRMNFADAGVLYTPPAVQSIDAIYLLEVGAGPSRRSARVDRAWLLAASGGPLWVLGRAGWTLGLSLAYSWSLS